MPSDHSVGLNNHQHGTPARPQPRQPNPEDAVPRPQSRSSLSFRQKCKLLPQRKILGRELCPVTNDTTDEQHQDANQTHFTASRNLNYGSETIAAAARPSNRKSFVDKAFGINVRDKSLLALN